MGITKCYEICQNILESAQLCRNQDNSQQKCKIYIDGLDLWYFSYNKNRFPDKKNATINLMKILSMIKKNNFIIDSVKIYLTGKTPEVKNRANTFHESLFGELLYWCHFLVERFKFIEFESLNFGEGESQCFFARDKNYPSIIVTNDSNILPICYKYQPLSDNDNVFFYILKKEIIYDARIFKTILCKNAFTLLLFLNGSPEFIEPLFTLSMIKLIFEILDSHDPIYVQSLKNINSIMIEINESNIEKCIAYFILILCDLKRKKIGKFTWPQANSKIKTVNYTGLLKWLIMYSNQGTNVENYNYNFKITDSEGVSKLQYFFKICKNAFRDTFKDVEDPENCKDLERIMYDISINEIINMV
ncbi:GSCOCT00014059001.2-RA-CDS [Cotesia congregata]|uniref:Cc_fen1_3c n=1 Tax=Cotesia congregata TaxID=51543 RepID=A0A8J2HHQ8_COTCN|nr:GSCOCT00014059001.2-RA-CDS [Cotesia congregata]CAG5095884.1 Cc_fen1_3c [Cotesia congregata]